MNSLRRAYQTAALAVCFCLCVPVTLFSATILSRDDVLARLVPGEAYHGIGAWETVDYWLATGNSTAIDAFGKNKGKRAERDFAEADAKALILKQAALAKTPDYDGGAYDLKGEVNGFQTAATYRIEGKDDLYLIGVAKKSGVWADVVFNPKKARLSAIALFESGKYHDAAGRFARLTQRGIQDGETMGFARASSWHVNLDAGVKAEARSEALEGLGQFYLKRANYDASLRYFYDLYLESEPPNRQLLDTLAMLCEKSGRNATAARFKKEISRRWPVSANVPITDASIEQEFEPVLLTQPPLLRNGGASLVQFGNQLYFLAVGVTEVRGATSEEKVRQLRVARVQAQKEAIAFTEQTQVVADEKLVEKTTVAVEGQRTSISVLKTIDQTTRTKVGGVLKSLTPVGSWKSSDGTLFFYALGKRLD